MGSEKVFAESSDTFSSASFVLPHKHRVFTKLRSACLLEHKYGTVLYSVTQAEVREFQELYEKRNGTMGYS